MKLTTIALVRGVAAISGTAAIMVGATLALTTNSVALSDSIQTSNADLLQISDGANPYSGITTFTQTTVIPGNPSTPKTFYLKNNSGGSLGVTLFIPTPPTQTGLNTYSGVHVHIRNKHTDVVTETDLQSLQTTPGVTLNGTTLTPNSDGTADNNGQLEISYTVDPGDISGTQATLTSIPYQVTGNSL